MKGGKGMLRVLSSRSFWNKDKTKELHIANLIDDNGNIAIDVFTQTLLNPGDYVDVQPAIYNHKLSCTVVPIVLKDK